jgi:hypothetical protein
LHGLKTVRKSMHNEGVTGQGLTAGSDGVVPLSTTLYRLTLSSRDVFAFDTKLNEQRLRRSLNVAAQSL